VKTLLIGYYGHGNLGDERLKQVCMDWIRSVDPQAEISTKKRDFFLADKVVFGGGGLFQNVTSFRSLLWYCSWAIMAWSYRKQYGLLGQGIGPVNGWVSNTLLDFVLKRADFVTVRDAVSFNRVKRVREVSHGPDMTLFTDLQDTITAFQASRDSLHASLLSYRDAYLRQENVHLTALRSFYEG
jgi:polysaccharide pyruvyl transferase WcaK-like protein